MIPNKINDDGPGKVKDRVFVEIETEIEVDRTQVAYESMVASRLRGRGRG